MVPTHEVSTPPAFMLDNTSEDDIFTIMPATFEPGKTGPFFISIATTDADFSLRRSVALTVVLSRTWWSLRRTMNMPAVINDCVRKLYPVAPVRPSHPYYM